MPTKKHLKEESSGSAAVLDEPRPEAKPVAVTISPETVRDRSPMQRRDSLEGVTKYLNARFWATNKRFEWAKDARGYHFEFTRFYFEQNVIVDVWPRTNNGTRTEAEKKRACIEAENAKRLDRKEEPIGYLSFVRGAIVPNEAFDRAMAGEALPLIERATEGVLA